MDEGINSLDALIQVRFAGDQFSINATTGVTTALCREASLNVPPILSFQVRSIAFFHALLWFI